MSAMDDDDITSASGHGDEGVAGKTVKVSIMSRLQAFRCSKSVNSGPSTSVNRLAPKTQHVTVNYSDDTRNTNCLTDNEKGDDDAGKVDDPVCSVRDAKIDDVNSLMEEVEDPSSTPISEIISKDPSDDMECSPIQLECDVVGVKSRENVIRPINRDVVHQICSGQVIVTLSTAVKELVENSIDAGAKKIDIRLLECGSKLIEVSDDASGIEENNFEGLALKHHTSKIAEFEDLGNLSTFGFRGEALSSLCALANLTVVTRHKGEQKSGYKIEYDYRGKIQSKVRCARDFGTTIILKDLFHTLPVRHKEFNKNLKKEYHRMVSVLYGYCLVVDGVRITCTNQVGNGGPQKVLSVPAYNSMKERIVTIFGSKQLMSLVEIKQCDEVPEEILAEYGLNKKSFERKYEIDGYISKPNQGRSSNDRQFYFINSRPCDPAKINRVINEVYHTFSRQQNPFVCLHIKTNKENVDVNVTPDKRTLYVQNEKILLATIKSSLIPILTLAAASYNPVNTTSSQQQLLSFTFSGHSQEKVENTSTLCDPSSFEIQSQEHEIQVDDCRGGFDPQYSTSTGRLSRSNVRDSSSFIKRFSRGSSSNETCYSSGGQSYSGCSFKRARETETGFNEVGSKQTRLSGYLRKFEVKGKNVDMRQEMEVEEIQMLDGGGSEGTSQDDISTYNVDNDDDTQVLYDDDDSDIDDNFLSQRKSVSVNVDWKNIHSRLISTDSENIGSSSVNYARRFRAKISPEDNSVAEDELKKQLTQDMFSKMDIIGQFNLGFIVVKNGPDLFIVDQHASDEKFNYEDQEKSTILQGQLLIHPLDLELPVISENIIMDHIEVFKKNGFDFSISPDEEPRKRVKMVKIPHSKNIEFGKPDVEELIFMLDDASNGKCFYRPTKVREMFASRACRKSVMIGTALSHKKMRDIVDHMGEMDQPWNCPHGRPTIRHLINLNLLPDLGPIKFNH